MVYQDILDWLNQKRFNDRTEAESYIKAHQGGVIYPQQIEALDFKYGAVSPIPEKPQTPLETLQRGEIEKRAVGEQPPTTKAEEQQRITIRKRFFSLIRKVFRRI